MARWRAGHPPAAAQLSSTTSISALRPASSPWAFISGSANPRMIRAASSRRSAISQGGVRWGVSSGGTRSNSRRMAGKLWRRGAGGVRRSSHHRTGSPASASRSQGDKNVRLPSIIEGLLIPLGDLAIKGEQGRLRRPVGSAHTKDPAEAAHQGRQPLAVGAIALAICLLHQFGAAQQKLAFLFGSLETDAAEEGQRLLGRIVDLEQMAREAALGEGTQGSLDGRQRRQEIADQNELGKARKCYA